MCAKQVPDKPKRKYRKPPLHEELPAKPPVPGNPATPVVEDGYVSKFVAYSKEFIFLPRADFKETSCVAERLLFWMEKCEQYDIRPTVIGMANALGIDRVRLYQLVSENFPNGKAPFGATEEVVVLLQKMYQNIAENLESGMQNGKVNPVAAMFLLKNHLGYSDTNELIVRRGNDDGALVDISEIRKRYQNE